MRIACFALSSLLTGCCFAAAPAPPAPVVPAPVIPAAVVPTYHPMPPQPASGAHLRVELVPQGEEGEEGLTAVRVLVTNTGAVDLVDVGVLAGCVRDVHRSFSLAAVRCGDRAGDLIEVRETERAIVVTRQAFDNASREVFPITEVGRISLGRAHIVRE